MIKLFVTGDNHFGKKYDRYPDVKDKLIQSRFDVLNDMVQRAEKEGCELFVVTGDLFDNINTVKISDVKRVVDILAAFTGTVIVLPGNHDYYTGNEKIWKDFENALSSREHNIILVKEFKPYSFDVGEEKVVIYPAFCQSKHSKENNLAWIKTEDVQKDGVINIGIAHGAIKGVTPDMKEEYFLMTESELSSIPMDAWLIGHTHIPYPNDLKEDSDTTGYKIFNAGTHEQTDLHNDTEGNGFIISIEKNASVANVLARKYVSGKIHFYDRAIQVNPDSETALADAIKKALAGIDKNSVVRIIISGSVKQTEYQDKERIYKEILKEYLTYEKEDSELSEEITVDKIREEYAETSFAAQFMEKLLENPTELQMAYQLLQSCKEN
ncbi:MAG: metallophosphoesterase [Clostridiales bacterium]|nr:metallophosphoesterase [Clostridiales bacterium]